MARDLLDASVLIAAFNTQDVHHNKARDILKRGTRVSFTDHVFDEVLGVLSRKLDKAKVLLASNALLTSDAELLFTTQEEFFRAYKRFSESKSLSFTDCCLLETAKSTQSTVHTFDNELNNAR